MHGLRLIVAASVVLVHAASAQEASWVSTYDLQETGRYSPYGDRIEIESMAPSPEGGFLAVGTWKRVGSSSRAWLGKIGPTGLLEWQRLATEGRVTEAYAVRATGAGYVVAGAAAKLGGNPTAWLFFVDLEGNPLWQRTFAKSAFARGPSALAFRADGTYVVVGIYGTFGNRGAWLLRVDGDGAVIASKRYRLQGFPAVAGVAETPDGGHVVVGSTRGSLEEEPNPFLLRVDSMGTPTAAQATLAARSVPHSVIPVASGGYVVGGTIDGFPLVTRLGADLTLQWQRALPVTTRWPGRVVVREAPGGGFTIAASAGWYAREGVFLFRLDASGLLTEELVYQPQALEPALMDVHVGSDGRMLAVGSSPGVAEESAVSWALRVGSAGARGGCPDVSWLAPPTLRTGALPLWSQLAVVLSEGEAPGLAEPFAFDASAEVRGGRACPGVANPLPFDWGHAAEAWTRCVVSPGSTGEPTGSVSRCAPRGCLECAYSFAEGAIPGKLPGAVIDLYAGIRGPRNGSPPVPKDPHRFASLLERVPTGSYLTAALRGDLARELAKDAAGPGTLARAVNAVELDQAMPKRALPPAAVRAGRSATADFGSIAWLDFRRVAKPGRATLEIAPGIPARLPDHLPLWPLATYRFRTDAALSKNGYVDLAFSTGGLPIRRAAAVRVLEWDGKSYRDVTRGADGARGVVSARTDRLREYVLMRFAPGASAQRMEDKGKPAR